MRACQMLRDGRGAVGIAAKSLRYCVGTMGRIPAVLPARMEDIVDTAVQTFGNCSAVVDFFRKLGLQLARQSLGKDGAPIPIEFVSEFTQSTGLVAGDEFRVAEKGTHWLDKLMAEYRKEVNAFLDRLEGLKARAMPPQQFLDFFVPAEAGAKKYRQYYGSLWQDFDQVDAELHHHTDVDTALAEAEEVRAMKAWFDGVREASEDFLSAWPLADRVDVVGATLSVVYKGSDGVEPVRDFIAFQRGNIRDWALESMRRAGILGEPVVQNGQLMLAIEDSPVPPRWHFPVYGAWAYSTGHTPTSIRGDLRKQLQAQDYAEPTLGRVFEFVETEVMVRGKVELRVALWDVEQNRLLGTLPRGYLNEDMLPDLVQVANAFIYDNALVLTCEAFKD